MAHIMLTAEDQLRNKIESGLAHCVDEHFYCEGCPYQELESPHYPVRCIYALLSDIQTLRHGDFQPLKGVEIRIN